MDRKTAIEWIEQIKHRISGGDEVFDRQRKEALDMAIVDMKICETNNAGWIRVKDRLPEYDKEVLIYAVSKTTNESKIAISYLMDKFYFGSRPINLEEPIWHEPWQYFRANNTITHWMPLPTPPEET